MSIGTTTVGLEKVVRGKVDINFNLAEYVMKITNLVFRILLIVVAVVAVLHTGIAYIVTLVNYNSFETSFPAESIFFFVGIWYVIGILLLLFVWLIIWLIKKISEKKRLNDKF